MRYWGVSRTGTGSRIKCEIYIYKTGDGKVIVEDEFLSFIVTKMITLSQGKIVLLASNNFSSEWVEVSKRQLFELCMTSIRCIKHRGPQKDADNIKDHLRVLNEGGENIPRFVLHYLDVLPPVGFGNMDASALLSRVEQVSLEVSRLRKILAPQAIVNENLEAVVTALDRRMTAVEKCDSPSQAHRTSVIRAHCKEASQELRTSAHHSQVQLLKDLPKSPPWTKVVEIGKG